MYIKANVKSDLVFVLFITIFSSKIEHTTSKNLVFSCHAK